MISLQTVFIALAGGIIPAFFWLWFWLHEDRKNPEPKHLLVGTFLLGMIAVPLTIPFETLVEKFIPFPLAIIFAWAFIEETLKYLAAHFGGMHTQAKDEPIDALIYLMTASLGFVAAENTLFILNPLIEGDVFVGIITGNIRFIGTSLLHVITSALIGGAIAHSFYRNKRVRHGFFWGGLAVATVVHTLFNHFIIQSGTNNLFIGLAVLWVCVIGLILLFERVKRIRPLTL